MSKEASARYDATHTRYVSLKLNLKTDADILTAIDGKPAQTEIKRLIRAALKNDKQAVRPQEERKMYDQYKYQDLKKAVEGNATQENITALVEWLRKYDLDSWNGECYDADDFFIYPIYKETAEDEFEIVGYEIR